ncbi:Branched-chain-amino-acid aminotransferase [Aquisphaera giovannonii]|uniref:branched-chain-amino-acid transaminase n=1 Tax=Aquisphaera giovannonii TaxID=406548 RepID=A0A5B9VYD6_9BACT|nr:aminotransferase class IV [Aquisphaera giovannonii]QEH32630.1 Branched-chain-amino-acid aminotransferase [Aquisphaera giovannonii]
MIWHSGEILPDDALRVSILDRTFEHGLGLFETFRTWDGRPTLLPRHMKRLACSARTLGLPLDPADLPDAGAVRALIDSDRSIPAGADAVLRVTLSGGLSPDGGGTLWMRAMPLPPPAPDSGCVLGPTHAARTDPLVEHKTLNYWPNRLAYDRARSQGCDESVAISPDGFVWEGSRTNLFVVADDQLLTPPCAGKALPGIMRVLVLERAGALGLDVREAPLGLFDPTFRPEEIFLTNSVRAILPVAAWGDARYPAPGPTTERLRRDVLHWLESLSH